MPKHLVTALGLIVSLGVIALGVFLVAMPLYLQAVGVDGQTATVASTNAIYQTQVDNLTEEEKNLVQIDAEVAELRSQIPATAHLDDVFEVVGRAAEASGVSLTSVTAGEQVLFTERTDVIDEEAAAAVPAPAPEPTPSATAGPADNINGTTTDVVAGGGVAAAAGRQQVDFVISATATDIAQATAFLDALRVGPRLLSSIMASTTQGSEGTYDMQISALTFIDAEG